MPRIANKSQFLSALAPFVKNNTVSRRDCAEAAKSIGLKYPPAWFVMDKTRSAGRGLFFFDTKIVSTPAPSPVSTPAPTPSIPVSIPMSNTNESLSYALAASTQGDRVNLVPDVNPEYVPWGHYEDILQIVKSNIFAPIFVTGLSGNGKTTMIEQVCAKLRRECFRVNITADTDEDELMGSWRLINGNMEWQDGPVILAMRRGAILLLDEVDLGTEKIMCLQAPLEGKGVYLKKIRELVHPAPGFNIIATANTKGKGSDDGRFVGTRVMNEAALDRYDFTYEQEYAPRATEKKILLKAMKKFGKVDEAFADCLVKWTEIIRKSFAEDAVSEIISTRRAINICKAYAMFGSKQKAISLALARFDKDTQSAFMTVYNKIDAGDAPAAPAVVPDAPAKEEEISVPF